MSCHPRLRLRPILAFIHDQNGLQVHPAYSDTRKRTVARSIHCSSTNGARSTAATGFALVHHLLQATHTEHVATNGQTDDRWMLKRSKANWTCVLDDRAGVRVLSPSKASRNWGKRRKKRIERGRTLRLFDGGKGEKNVEVGHFQIYRPFDRPMRSVFPLDRLVDEHNPGNPVDGVLVDRTHLLGRVTPNTFFPRHLLDPRKLFLPASFDRTRPQVCDPRVGGRRPEVIPVVMKLGVREMHAQRRCTGKQPVTISAVEVLGRDAVVLS